MRNILSLLPICCAITAHTQSCLVGNNVIYGEEFYTGDALVQPDGGVIQLSYQDNVPGTYIIRWAPDAAMRWFRYVGHMSPDKHLFPGWISGTPEGGSLMNGAISHNNTYVNFYAMEMDSDANPLWARYYMLDSTLVMQAFMSPLVRLADGGYVLAINTMKGLSLTRMDQNAVPIWTKRYVIGNGRTGGDVFEESNGDLTLHCGKSTLQCLIRTDENGVVLSRNNFTGGANPSFRTANGDYIGWIRLDGGCTSIAVARWDPQGHMIWRRSFPSVPEMCGGFMTEMTNGHIVLQNDPGLVELAADGTLLNAWSGYPWNNSFITQQGDSLFYRFEDETQIADHISAGISIATDLATGCGWIPSSTTSTVASIPATSTDDTLYVIRDTLKTWTMNIGQMQNANAFDPKALLTFHTARPGFDHYVPARITNNSLDHATGPITATLTFSPLIQFVSAVPAPSLVSGQTITWNLPAAGPHTELTINTLFHTPADPGLIGSPINYAFTFTQDSTELSLANNTVVRSTTVLGSFDPNTKEVLPRDNYNLSTDSILDYTLRFQNTGTAAATNVVLRDTLPMSVDVSSFRLGAYSHPCTYSITGNGILTFTFHNINLPDSNTNEAASHGLVEFTIKPVQTITLGQTIANFADIYFDFNPPIRTDTATVIVMDALGVASTTAGHLFLYPVPAKERINAMLPARFTPVSAWAIGIDGRITPLWRTGLGYQQATYDVHQLPPGAYVLSLVGGDGQRLSARFVKE